MQGLEISKKYYLEYGKPMLEELFPDVIGRIAVGLSGEGSQCLGYDDEISKDHDFEAGFCLWITEEDEKDFGFRLERAYSKLPKEYMGLKRSALSPTGGNRYGVITIEDFYLRFIGSPSAPESLTHWLSLQPSSLSAATSGEVFFDDLGVFSAIRNSLLCGYPEDVKRKKLAAHLVFMAQAGQYNYPRIVKRGDNGAAQLAIFEFVKNAISAIYLINNKYEPFYKWAYRGMRELERLGSLADSLAALTELENSAENIPLKLAVIEDIASLLSEELRNTELSDEKSTDLEKHAYSVTRGIKDPYIRNMHVMAGI